MLNSIIIKKLMRKLIIRAFTKFMKKNIELFITFFKIGLFTFGGGYSMLPMLTREVCNNKKWVVEEEILDYYAIGQCTPGVIAVNVATFIGKKENGILGAFFATLGVISPSIIIISIISYILTGFVSNKYVGYFLSGIRISVTALLIVTITKLIRKNVANIFAIVVLFLSFVCAYFTPVPTIVIVLLCAISGYIFDNIKGAKHDIS